jgi:type III restriction enzyme
MARSLRFKFEASQSHQNESIQSVIGLFKEFSQDIAGFQLEYDVIPNIQDFYDFEEEWLYSNYLDVIKLNNELKIAKGLQPDIDKNSSLVFDDGLMLDVKELNCLSVRYPVFTIEMETGTGKTYTYFKTIHELRKQYGFRKFIIVVPSIAIYEGTIKAFKQTKEHFKTLYGNENIHLTEYDGQQVSRVRSFATSSFTEILVMTIDSFNKSSNIIYKATEKLQGEWLPIQYIQATRPILILDESQNYRSDLSRQALRTLNPLFAINYSATPVDKYNLIYRLSPVDAFRQNLVKKIGAIGVTQRHNLNDNALSLVIERINNEKGLPTAELQAYVIENGIKTQRSIKLKTGDDLFTKTHNSDFNGFIVEEINSGTNEIKFTNQSILNTDGTDSITLFKTEIYRVQIEETIKAHFDLQNKLKEKGIKVLSLFFIDRVSNYVGDDPLIKSIFEDSFNRFKKRDDYFKNYEVSDVHKGYFAKKKTKKETEETIDSFEITGKNESEKKKIKEAEKEAFHLIMKDKETLLTFYDGKDDLKKVSFIFAHSALREGWDNPNVFNICLLKEPNYNNENTRRQEIGRGLRICVNQEGERVMTDDINNLTVIVPEDFSKFVENLQKEYTENGDVAPSKITNAKREKVKRNEDIYESSDFKKFWNNLIRKTEYKINIDSNILIKNCIERLNSLSKKNDFPETQIVLTKGEFVISEYNFFLLESLPNKAKIKLSITDIKGRNDIYEQWYGVGYDFGRKSRDLNLSGFKIVQIDHHSTEPTIHFGNGISLSKEQSHSFSGDPDIIQNQRTVQQAQSNYPVFNLIDRTSKNSGLTRPTINSIFKGLKDNKKKKIFSNPEGFASVFIKEIRDQLADHISKRIEYYLTDELEKFTLEESFPAVRDFPQRELIPGSKTSIYDQIQTDSDVEKRFVQFRIQEDDREGNVLCYFKFPYDFKIKIPKIIGNYVPDWGIVRNIDGKAKIELVRETKGTMNPNLLQFPNEYRKIKCASKHFDVIGVDYKQVTDESLDWYEPANAKEKVTQEKIYVVKEKEELLLVADKKKKKNK